MKLSIAQMMDQLKNTVQDAIFQHSVRVMQTAMDAAVIHGEDVRIVQVAGLLHDCSKHMDAQTMVAYYTDRCGLIDTIRMQNPRKLLHAPVSALLAKEEYGVTDPCILQAIASHTLGRVGMHAVEKIVFLCDYTEPNRDFPGIDVLRKWVKDDLDRAIVLASQGTIRSLIEKNQIIHPQLIATMNDGLVAKK